MTPPPGLDAPQPPPLTLRTLGAAGLYAAEGAEPVLGPGKPLALLIYLALTPGRRTSREFLIDLLWADLDPDRARPALRQALFHLRRLLGEETISGTEELTLRAAFRNDRDEFLAAIERGDLEGAMDCYRGSFLPTFGVPGGAAFEHWADLERDRVRTAFLRSAEILVRRHLNHSRFREAQRLARRVRELVPDLEAAWRLVLEVAVTVRDFVGAAVEADNLEQWSTMEGLSLEPATRAAMARARRLTPSIGEEAGDAGLMAELTGREREFSAITSAWDAVRSGPARHLHLTAPPGLGKSRLLRDALARLAATGAPIARVQGTPGDREVPYAFLGDLARAIAELPGATGIAPASASTLVALNPALSGRLAGAPDTATGEEALRRRVLALADLVHSVADEQPFVLAIDDLHWIDAPSFRALEGLWNRLGEAHALCLTTARPERLPVGPGIEGLPLQALTAGQVSSLISALGAVPAQEGWGDEFVSGVHQATGGSPLLILETLRLALDQGALVLDSNEWRCLEPERLRALLRAGEAVRERVRALPFQHGWLLALLATAGSPLDAEALAGMAGLTVEETGSILGPLEHLGLVVKTGAAWLPAHDEIARASLGALSAEQRAEADRAVGRLMAGARDADPHRLLRASRHFLAAGDQGAVRELHRRYVLRLREQGDRRATAQLAAEMVGAPPESPQVRELVRSLPASWRLGLWSRPRLAAAWALFLLLPLATIAAVRVRAAGESALTRVVYADSAGATTAIMIHPAQWDGSNTPLITSPRRSDLSGPALAYPETSPAISPDGRSVAWTQDSGDSTTLDIWIRTPAGTRRLTNAPRDDLVTGWLPDGSALIGYTFRWSPRQLGDYDIAVFDTATGAAKQLTHGDANDEHPFVSPDGTRIVFARYSRTDPPMACLTTIDARMPPECRLVAGKPVSRLAGWSSPTEIVALLEGGTTRPLVVYDWARDAATTILGPHVSRALLSPDRRWVTASLRLDGIRGSRDWVVPIGEPGRGRPVGGPRAGRGDLRWFEGLPDRSPLVDRIEFSDSVTSLLPGVGTRLSIRALSATGTELPVRAPIYWSSSDSTIATVDSTGVVRARRQGEVTVTASLAGWRTASKHLRTTGASPVTRLTERWDPDWHRRWIAWGDPAPQVVTGPGGIRGFWNAGDGVYYSMGLFREAFSARDGLGLEVKLSTPLFRPQWQRMRISLVADLDTTALLRGSQQKFPASLGRPDASCAVTFPGEGQWGATRLGTNGGVAQDLDLGEFGRKLRSGAWWTLRLQLLPDGRCGIAINGRVISLSPEPISLEGEFRIRIGDESVETRILHGPLQLWTGVRTDIDWSKSPSLPPS